MTGTAASLLVALIAVAPPASPVASAAAVPLGPARPPVVSIVPSATGPTVTFADRAGTHTVVFTLKDLPAKDVDGEALRGRTLHAVHTVRASAAARPATLFETHDAVRECQFDVTLELIDGSLTVTDSDGDGVSEVAFAYALSCRSDVSPDDLKLLVYEGTVKYALRGTRAVVVGTDEATGEPATIGGGEPAVDPAFNAADPRILAAAQAQWRTLQTR